MNVLLSTLLLTVFTQRNFVADFLLANCDFTRKTAVSCFWAPFGAQGQRALIILGSLESDFLLVLIELFFRYVLRLMRYIWAYIGSKSAISLQQLAGWPKISGRRGRPTNHSSSQKTRLNLSSVLSQCMRLTDRQTNTLLIAAVRAGIPCSVEKKQQKAQLRQR